MKIVHVTPHVRNVGNGIVNVTVDLACAQADAGHDVAVFSAGGDFVDLLAAHGVRHVEVGLKPSFRSIGPAIVRIRRALASGSPDIVHVHMMNGALIAWLVRMGLNYRIVSTVHTAFRRGTIVMGLADEVIAVSNATADSLRRVGVPARKITLVYNAPLGSPRRSKPQVPLDSDLVHPSIVSVAGLYRRKGIDVLIEAFDRIAGRFPQASLYIAGEGPDGRQFRALAEAARHRDRIHFLGLVKDPRSVLEAADIFVLASREDPFPLVIAEARSAGCAMIGSDVDGIPESLADGQRGQLFPSENVTALASLLEGLLADSESLRRWQAEALNDLDFYMLPRLVDDVQKIYVRARAAQK